MKYLDWYVQHWVLGTFLLFLIWALIDQMQANFFRATVRIFSKEHEESHQKGKKTP